MKRFLLACALTVFSVPAAQAQEDRISVNDIHNFIAEANMDLNSFNLSTARNFLNRTVSDDAVFETTVLSNYTADPALRWAEQRDQQAVSRYAYRYPYRYPYNSHYPHHQTVSAFQEVGKWDKIRDLEYKRAAVVGYRQEYRIKDMTMRPYATSAVIDVEVREFGLGYSPIGPQHTAIKQTSLSDCSMYVEKQNDALVLTRMGCTVRIPPYM